MLLFFISLTHHSRMIVFICTVCTLLWYVPKMQLRRMASRIIKGAVHARKRTVSFSRDKRRRLPNLPNPITRRLDRRKVDGFRIWRFAPSSFVIKNNNREMMMIIIFYSTLASKRNW